MQGVFTTLLRKTAFLLCFLAFSAIAGEALVSSSDKVYINSATATEIADYLDGIGPAKAQAIVAYRDSQGPFTDLQSLQAVKGVGAKTLEKNADRLAFDLPQAAAVAPAKAASSAAKP